MLKKQSRSLIIESKLNPLSGIFCGLSGGFRIDFDGNSHEIASAKSFKLKDFAHGRKSAP
jgi:hypothetical protein